MKQKGYDSLNGYITIISLFIFSILLSLVMVLITGVQKSTMQVEAELALDTACNSALAEYHQELLSQYDLFFIDTAYGTEQANIEALEEHIRYYATKNLENTNFWDTQVVDMNIAYAELASDESGEVLEKQMLEYMENKLGIDALAQLADKYDFAVEGNKNVDTLLKNRDDNQARLDREPTPVKISYKEKYDKETGETKKVEVREEVPIVNPAENVNRNRSKGILNLVTENSETISGQEADLNQYYSHRERTLEGSGFLTEKALMQENPITERLLVNLYLQEKCGCYTNLKEKSYLKYQQEYILCGANNDIDNLKGVVYRLSSLREAVNASYLYSDSVKRAEISALASSVAAVTVAPHIQPLLETSILFAWAYVESLYDIRVLLDGGKVPLIKTADTWHTDLSTIFDFESMSIDTENKKGLDYEDYLNIFLYIENKEQLLEKTIDIIEMDVRQIPYNENFKIDGCVSAFQAQGFFQSSNGYLCDITRLYNY